MPNKSIHLTNANNLTHHWDPESTEETLMIDKDIINMVPNTKHLGNWPRELHNATVAIRELEIVTLHCKAITRLGNKINTEIEALPSTHITEHHEKISAYQGMINLLFNHLEFLKDVSATLQSKFQRESTPFVPSITNEEEINTYLHCFLDKANQALAPALQEELALARSCKNMLDKFELAKNKNSDALRQLLDKLKDYKHSQEQSAMPWQRLIISTRQVSEVNFIIEITPSSASKEFIIGQYSHQNKNYYISVSITNHSNDTNNFLTQNPLGNLCFISRCSNSLKMKTSVEVGVAWALNDYPIVSAERENKLEPTAIEINYIRLFLEKTPQIPCVEPSLIIKNIIQTGNVAQHIGQLYQVIVEWMQFYSFDKIVFYGSEMDALNCYGFGFSTFDDELSMRTRHLLSEHLDRGEVPCSRVREAGTNDTAIPFILRNNDLQRAELYNFKSKTITPYAQLIHKKPILNKALLPNKHPKFSGVGLFPYRNTVTMSLQREIGQVPKRCMTKVVTEPVNYHDMLNSSERMACAQVGPEELKKANAHLPKGEILKVKLL